MLINRDDASDDSNYDSDGEKLDVRKFLGDADLDDDFNDSDDEEFDVRKFHSNAVGLDDVNDDFYDVNDDFYDDNYVSDATKFHGDTAEPDIDYNDDDDEEFNSMRFHGVSKNKNQERVCYSLSLQRQIQKG